MKREQLAGRGRPRGLGEARLGRVMFDRTEKPIRAATEDYLELESLPLLVRSSLDAIGGDSHK